MALFSSTVDTSVPYLPIVTEPDDHPGTAPHGLDREVASVLPALWYFLHLPRIFAETIDLPGEALGRLLDARPDHAVLLVPVEEFKAEHLPTWPPTGLLPVLLATADGLLSEAERICGEFNFLLPPLSVSDLSDATLESHWQAIHEGVAPSTTYVGGSLALSQRFDTATVELPVRRLGRQLHHDLEAMPDAGSDPGAWLGKCLTQHALVRALAALEAEDLTPAEAEPLLAPRFDAEAQVVQLPIVLAAPGVPSPYLRAAHSTGRALQRLAPVDPRDTWAPDIHERDDDLTERAAIEFLACHMGVQDGFALMLPTIPGELFAAFSNIEEHWSNNRGPNAVTVRRLMTRLDQLAEPLWTDVVVAAIQRASQLTVFSNFPVGILRLPGDTAPLSCRVPISHRPLIPLTRAIQLELGSRQADLSQGCRVLVAECIPADDTVGKLSRGGWEVAAQMFDAEAGGGSSSLVREDTHSIEELRAAISGTRPHVLVLSAHGHTNGHVAGVMVGREFCLGPELEIVPPVVVLSACSVAPRGRGQVHIADLLLREGAVAVLGPHVPVDVRHNASLIVRLFVYMSQSIEGAEPHSTLLDAWRRTQSSHALLDVLYGNTGLTAFGSEMTPRGTPILTDFMNRASVGRLRPQHIYDDTEAVLVELADEIGIGAKVRSLLKSPGYVPESAFYTFIGRPDRVWLNRPPWATRPNLGSSSSDLR
ncbi:MAG: hypothetical protein M3394_00515 [Actinomycetota bacterium]|nr:hypothetical protein [Actinomycetota bacterium]